MSRPRPKARPVRTPEQEMAARSRRGFLTMGIGAAAGFGGWSWLRSRGPEDGDLEWPLRRALRFNEKIAGAYFSDNHRVPLFRERDVVPNPRLNGDVGLTSAFDPSRWTLHLTDLRGQSRELSLDDIRRLPKVEQITQLNCVEGWTQVVHWTGARFADFTARYAPGGDAAAYIEMKTPDQEYFVGLDAASALHPQTLVCYEMNGQPLSAAHGAPLRLVIPVKYGLKNIKRIGSISYSQNRPRDYWAEDGYDWYAGL